MWFPSRTSGRESFIAESPEETNSRFLRVAVRQGGGSVAAAARIIGIDRDTVYYWAAKYGIEIDDSMPRARR